MEFFYKIIIYQEIYHYLKSCCFSGNILDFQNNYTNLQVMLKHTSLVGKINERSFFEYGHSVDGIDGRSGVIVRSGFQP